MDDLDKEYSELLQAGEPQPKATRRARGKKREPYRPEEDPEFDCGAVVQLRSGGPLMTVWTAVSAVAPGFWPWMYHCYWFEGDTLRKETFPGHVLREKEE